MVYIDRLIEAMHENFTDVGFIFYALLIFMVLDYITGIFVAVIFKSINSKIGFVGIMKKIFILLIFIMGLTIDTFIIGQGQATTLVITSFYLGNEGFSILENAQKMKLPLPENLINILDELQKKK